MLTYVYVSTGREEEALGAGEKALALNPLDAQTYNNLAWIYATTSNKELRDLKRAEEYALKAVELTQDTHGANLDYIDTLVEVYLKRGRKRG